MAETPVGEVILKNVRLSFPALFETEERQNEDGETRRVYKASFLIPKEGDEFGNMAKLSVAAEQVKARKWGPDKDNWPKLKSERLCVRDGDEEPWDGYAGHFYVSASSPESRPPAVITNRKDKDGRWIEAKPGQQGCPYAGCYVNAVVRLWAQDDRRYGKRINASLEAVQFRADGKAFGAAPVDPNQKFSDEDVSDVVEFGDEDMI
jgi:hypothetical protein